MKIRKLLPKTLPL